MADHKQKLIEITRSFSYKLNVGNFESRDFFCSQKAEVPKKQAKKTSEALYEFCKSEVIKSVNKYKEDLLPKPIKPEEAIKSAETYKKSMGLETDQEKHDRQSQEENIIEELKQVEEFIQSPKDANPDY